MKNTFKNTTYILTGLTIGLLLLLATIFVVKEYWDYKTGKMNNAKWALINKNSYLQPFNKEDGQYVATQKSIDDKCSINGKYDIVCLKDILAKNNDAIEDVVNNIINNSQTISNEFVQQGIYQNDKTNPHSAVYGYLDQMVSSLFPYTDGLCKITVIDHSSDDKKLIQTTICGIHQTDIFIKDLYVLRQMYISDYLIDKIKDKDIKTEKYRAAVKEEKEFLEIASGGKIKVIE
jgi:hypothetical protein